MRAFTATMLSVLALSLTSCGGDGGGPMPMPTPTPAPSPTPTPTPTPAPTPGPKPTLGSLITDFSFANDANGFTAGYADYALGQESAIGFAAGIEALPSPLSGAGFAISAANPSSDVFVFIWKRITGLAPNQPYQVTVSLRLATNAPPACPSGQAGNVTIKAGAAAVQPATLTQAGRVIVNFDKGDQRTSGTNAVVLGDLAQTTVAGTCDRPLYSEKTLTTGAGAPTVASDANGNLWLVIGADSGFSGTTKLYFIGGQATFSPTTS